MMAEIEERNEEMRMRFRQGKGNFPEGERV